jgi:condensin-2 complex subunit D3
VRLFARGSLTQLIVAKWPRQFHKHFVEALFYYNKCTDHKTYNQFPDKTSEAAFSLPGAGNQKLRFQVYNYMLGFMQDEHKFNTTCKLCQDILGAVVDGDLLLGNGDGPVAHVVKDCLLVLSSGAVKLKSVRATRNAAAHDVDVDTKQGRMELAKGKLLSKLVKKNALENIVPLLIELKRLLERKRSPLLADLMLYLQELLSDYQSEIDEILAADPQLAMELKYDLAQFAERQRAQKRLSDMQSIGSLTTPIAGMPSVTPRKPLGRTQASFRTATKTFATPRLKKSASVANSAGKKLDTATTPTLMFDLNGNFTKNAKAPFQDISVSVTNNASAATGTPERLATKKRPLCSPPHNAEIVKAPASKSGKTGGEAADRIPGRSVAHLR